MYRLMTTAAVAASLVVAIGVGRADQPAPPFELAQVSMTPPSPNVTPKAMETIGAAEETPAATPAAVTPHY